MENWGKSKVPRVFDRTYIRTYPTEYAVAIHLYSGMFDVLDKINGWGSKIFAFIPAHVWLDFNLFLFRMERETKKKKIILGKNETSNKYVYHLEEVLHLLFFPVMLSCELANCNIFLSFVRHLFIDWHKEVRNWFLQHREHCAGAKDPMKCTLFI